ncbi:ABC transporter ATP-binding protein [Saccharopolyspora hattusasensis]|uniref:ABC transporter ATP-binding protein n=1 Tax=Saccharopolyspora hattusasensis TaxID=1128679 RepID=UPI003D983E92
MAHPATGFAASSVEARGVTRRFGEHTVLDAVDLTIPSSSFFCLLGPSGCGKTTLLRIIAGLDLPDSGTLHIGGSDHTRTPTHRRPTNLVFQSGALFPHLNVAENIAFGLRTRKTPKAEIRRRVGEMLELVAMDGYENRSLATLSGGQRQRVAIARSLVRRPDVLLLDEPLSALDLSLQLRMRRELRTWQQETGTTFVCVTHNQAEAMELGDRIAVLNAGRIEQAGTGRELYESPRSRFVAGFIGENNIFDAADSVDGIAFPDIDNTGVEAFAVRPEDVRLVGMKEGGARGEAIVQTASFTGKSIRVAVTTSTGRELLAELAPSHGELFPGQQVGIAFPAEAVRRLGWVPGQVPA